MRIVLAALMVACRLQFRPHARGKQRRGRASRSSAAEQQKKSREEEKAYKDALGRIPNQKPADPWSKMR